MAHVATLNTLTEQLVGGILSHDQQDGRLFRDARQAALRGVRSAQYARVNQFDVQSRLSGLDEKFRVLNNDLLADRLKDRLDELARIQYVYKPEVLSLFLHLSDRPHEKIELFNVVVNEKFTQLPTLTWAQVFAAEPPDGDGIWDDFRAESDISDEELNSAAKSVDTSPSTNASSLDEEGSAAIRLLTPDTSGLDTIRNARLYLKSDPAHVGVAFRPRFVLSEYEAVRESLTMICGSPSRLFATNATTRMSHYRECCISTMSQGTSIDLFQQFDEINSSLCHLRQWTNDSAYGALQERYKAAFGTRLRRMQRQFSEIGESFVHAEDGKTISLPHVLCEVQDISRPCLRLCSLLPTSMTFESPTWQLLDSIYAEACVLHLSHQTSDFGYFLELLCEILPAYLAPVRDWLANGNISNEHNWLFIEQRSEWKDGDYSSLWHDRYILRTTSGGSADAPRFMQGIAHSIFAEGKSVMFLRALGKVVHSEAFVLPPISELSFARISEKISKNELVVFPAVFDQAILAWIEAGTSLTQVSLGKTLLHEYGMHDTIQTLAYIFLSSDGAAFQVFADTVSERLRTMPLDWSDEFVLTDLARSSFGDLPTIDTGNVSIEVAAVVQSSSKVIISGKLSLVKMCFHILWPLQNITREHIPLACQSVFTFLLQVYWARSLLQRLTCPPHQRLRHASEDLRGAVLLRHRLLHFADIMYSHICQEGQRAIRELQQQISASIGIDAMAEAYKSFTKQLLNTILLADNLTSIHNAILSILTISDKLEQCWSRTAPLGASSLSSTYADAADPVADDHDHITTANPSSNITELRREFERLHAFIISGLRSLARARAEPAWSMLLDRLT